MAALLHREIRKSGLTLKGAVNHFLRLGLVAAKQPSGKPFVVRPRALGLPAGLSYDNVGELLEKTESLGKEPGQKSGRSIRIR
uniref:Uncharacterized protein n=1 Tax=Paracidobacterium acidisoli TaxID=2303751 RepID=A0A372IKY6_9BACT